MAKSVKVTGTGFGVTGTITIPSDRAIHETGGTITARNTKYLAIPLPAALNSQGVPLLASPRLWANTFVSTSKAGNLIIFQRQGRSAIPLYVLKPEVRIKARLGLQVTMMRQTPQFIAETQDLMVRAMMTAMEGI